MPPKNWRVRQIYLNRAYFSLESFWLFSSNSVPETSTIKFGIDSYHEQTSKKFHAPKRQNMEGKLIELA